MSQFLNTIGNMMSWDMSPYSQQQDYHPTLQLLITTT